MNVLGHFKKGQGSVGEDGDAPTQQVPALMIFLGFGFALTVSYKIEKYTFQK